MSFSHKYNTDDVLIRAHIVGLVNQLNNKIKYENVWADDRRETVRVPFFYAMSGDERFLQDYFSNWSDCAPDFIEGNTDPIPRGTIFLTGVSVLASNLTSRYVRGYYTKEIDGELKRYNSYINSIPIQMNFSAEILADTTLDTFKITQSIIATFFKTITFSVNYLGFRVPVQAGFPEGYTLNKQFEFTYGNTDRLKVTFDLELQGYLPIPDPKQEFFAGDNMQAFTFNSNVAGETTPNIISEGTLPPVSANGVPLADPNDYMVPPNPGINLNPTAGDGGNNGGAGSGYGTTPPSSGTEDPGTSEFSGDKWM